MSEALSILLFLLLAFIAGAGGGAGFALVDAKLLDQRLEELEDRFDAEAP